MVPVKRLTRAKTRLALPPAGRALLARAFAVDTVAALCGSAGVSSVLVVTDDGEVAAALPPQVDVVEDPGQGLTGAVARGVTAARSVMPGHSVLVVPADLPSLRSVDVDDLLEQAPPSWASFAPDLRGDGTTVVVLPAGVRTMTAYGAGSAQRHAALGLAELDQAPTRARQDVDALADLANAVALGVGISTERALAHLRMLTSA
ncbi:MAG: 2-phospho-L-lactate guanylyltransferase [Actinomycetes bacterium]